MIKSLIAFLAKLRTFLMVKDMGLTFTSLNPQATRGNNNNIVLKVISEKLTEHKWVSDGGYPWCNRLRSLGCICIDMFEPRYS